METGGYGVTSLRKVLHEEGYRGLYRGMALLKTLNLTLYDVYRLFSFSLLYTAIPHLVFPFIRKVQTAFQREKWLA